MEVITTREPPGTGTDFEVGQVEERFEQFLPTSAQFPAFFSVLKMASESAKSRKKRKNKVKSGFFSEQHVWGNVTLRH